jgi:hypothetical protein
MTDVKTIASEFEGEKIARGCLRAPTAPRRC